MSEETKNALTVSGRGGIGKSDGSSGTQAQNTLQSNTLAQLIEMLGEGPIGGLVNGSQSIYFNQTPLQNADGTYNFGGLFTWNSSTNTYDPVSPGSPTDGGGGSKIQGGGSLGPNTWMSGVAWQATTGTPDQAVLAGFPSSTTTTAVATQIQNSIGPLVRTIEDTNTTSVIVVIGIPALSTYDPSSGNLNGASVSWTIDVAPYGGAYVNQVTMNIVNQKCTSLYLCQSVVTLPPGGAPWNIRVTRTCSDNLTNINISSQTWWESYTEVVSGQFIYPNTALVGLTINAQFFGSSIPTRGYLVNGLLTDIPSNYTPTQGGGGTYSGVWDGTFQTAWHSNPAWVLYALLTNDRWGLGEFIDVATVDKWGLYAVAQYCDELIPSGFTATDGSPILEPRYVFNGVINSREEAFKVLQNVASCFRGMVYWSLGQVFAVADMPTDPITTVSPANVIGGVFNYSGTAMKARHSVAAVSWNDPQDFYRPAIELVQNDAMVQKFGWRQVDVAAPGCTSRGQALRYGKWILAVEQYETETVEFTMSWDSYVLEGGTVIQPGNIIFIADPRKTGGARIGGRLKTVTSASNLTIDAPFAPGSGDSYTLTVMQPDGSIETQPINHFDSSGTVLTMSTPFAQTPNVGAMWVIQGTDVNPRQYRVLSVQEQDSHLFKITALFYDPEIYALVEDGIVLSPPPYVKPNLIEGPPVNGTAVESNYFLNGVPSSTVTVSWSQPVISIAVGYGLSANSPNGTINFPNVTGTSCDFLNLANGDWTFFVTAIGPSGAISVPLPIPIDVQGWSAVTVPTAVDLSLLGGGGGTIFNTDAPTIVWQNQFPSGVTPYPIQNMVQVYDPDTSVLLRTETFTGLSYTYSFEDNTNDGGPRRNIRFDVSALSVTGVPQPIPATITVSNPQEPAITPTLSTVLMAITVDWTPVDLDDYAGAFVWVSTNSGFDPLTTTPTWSGPGTSTTVIEMTAGNYYVVVAAYDSFGNTDLNIGGEAAIYCSGLNIQAFDNQLQALITAQFQEIQASIDNTQSIIASAAAEQAAAQATDKYNVKTFISTQVAALTSASTTSGAALLATINSEVTLLNATVGQNFTVLSTAISNVLTTAKTYADSSISSYATEVAATYGTLTELSAAQSNAIETADAYTDSSIAAYNITIQALYATQDSVANAISSAINAAESTAADALSLYETTVVATYATLAGLASASATTLATADSNATAALSSYATTVAATFATTNAAVTLNAGAIATLNDSFTTYQTTLSATLADMNASISDNATAVADASDALSTFETSVAATYTNTTGMLTAINTAQTTAEATAAAALASYESVVTATLGGSSATVTISIGNPAAVSWTTHGLAAGSLVVFSTTGALPSGLLAGTTYYVISTGLTANSFEVSLTPGGAAIVTSGTQSGTQTCTAQGLSAGVTTLSEAVATINGNLAAQWLLTLNVNNYISGIQVYDDGATANIVFITDNFKVVSPAQGVTTPVPLFAIGDVTVGGVTTANIVLNGNFIANGTISADMMAVGSITAGNAALGNAVVGNANIQNLAVGTANIQNLAVGTLQIAGNAVTVPSYSASGSFAGNSAYQLVLSPSVTFTAPSGDVVVIEISANFEQQFPFGANLWYVELQAGGYGTLATGQGNNTETSISLTSSVTATGTGSAQTITAYLYWWGTSGYLQLTAAYCTMLGVMR